MDNPHADETPGAPGAGAGDGGTPAAPTPATGEKKWYIVHTYSGHENKAKLSLLERVRNANLTEFFGDVLVPTESVMEMVKGRSAAQVADMSRDELLEEVGIPLTPVRLKCALLGLGVLKVALHRARGTPLPEEWAGIDDLEFT